MSINTQNLFDQKASAFGAPTNSARFTSDFITAVNRTLLDIRLKSLITTDTITDVSEDIGLDAKYEAVLSIGIDYHLLAMGQQSAMDKRDTYALFSDQLRTAQMEAQADLAAADNFPVKLGDLSDA